MLPDPITIAAASPTPALVFSVIQTDGLGAERADAAGVYSLTINHQKGKGADRHYMRISQVADAVNPYTGTTSKQVATVSLSISVPKFGFDATAMVALVKALTDTLADSEVTSARILQFQS
jgi:hypothetical protein